MNEGLITNGTCAITAVIEQAAHRPTIRDHGEYIVLGGNAVEWMYRVTLAFEPADDDEGIYGELHTTWSDSVDDVVRLAKTFGAEYVPLIDAAAAIHKTAPPHALPGEEP